MTNSVSARRRVGARAVTVTAMFSAVAFVLMFLEFSLPIIPSFVKMDVSELPALLASFSLGPGYGVAVCLVKNVLAALFHGSTGGLGEACHFLIGAAFTGVAGVAGAPLGAAAPAEAMAWSARVLSVPSLTIRRCRNSASSSGSLGRTVQLVWSRSRLV